MKRGKFVLVGLSGILVVGVVIGLISGVKYNHKSSSNNNSNADDKALASASKAVAAICTPTNYKQACVDSLKSVSHNESATPQELIQAAIQYTIDEVKRAVENSSHIKEDAKDPLNKMASDDCQELLQFAVQELQSSLSMVSDPNMQGASERDAELNNWLSAVIGYQENCLDGFNSTELRDAMSQKLSNSKKLSDNALAIVTAMNDIFKALNIPVELKSNPSSRRLLEQGEGGYPTWMSVADRKLLQRRGYNVQPNAVVARDGSGQYKTIGAALAAYPKGHRGRYVIYVKAGVYDEIVTVAQNQVNVFMYGDGPKRTIVTGKRSNTAGYTTQNTATFSAVGNGFIAKSMGFRNTAGPQGHQAVALRTVSDMSAFYNCRMDGFQDTLYAQHHRSFFRNCIISGTVDFIFGMGSTVIQNSIITVRMPMHGQQNTVTAHGRESANMDTGVVIQNSRIVPAKRLSSRRFQVNTFMGRPWKAYSRAVFMENILADFIRPGGWMIWDGTNNHATCFFAEYANTGPGSKTDNRVPWAKKHLIWNRNGALPFTAGNFLKAQYWLPRAGVPFYMGLAR